MFPIEISNCPTTAGLVFCFVASEVAQEHKYADHSSQNLVAGFDAVAKRDGPMFSLLGTVVEDGKLCEGRPYRLGRPRTASHHPVSGVSLKQGKFATGLLGRGLEG